MAEAGSFFYCPSLSFCTDVTPCRGQARQFQGRDQARRPLEDGPSLTLAEIVPRIQRALTQNGCPSDNTAQVVRAVWGGGITKPGGADVDDLEREL